METSASNQPPRFDLALCLAGGVSTGSWIAGALDFLVEALDAWEDAKAAGRAEAPRHRLVLSSIAGASAGAQAGVLLAMVLRSRFPHVRLDSGGAPADAAGNPLYAGWVLGADARQLLDLRDGSDAVFRSLLDGSCTDEIGERALAATSRLPQRGPRAWLADPLRVSFAVTNLEGVPLQVDAAAQPLRAWRLHADALRHAVSGLGSQPGRDARHDEIQLAYPADPAALPQAWRGFVGDAAASGALPVLLPARRVERETARYRPVRIEPPAGLKPSSTHFMPLWPEGAEASSFRFTAADGGVLNNDPVDLAREGLDHGRRDHSAVLLIHPLLGEARAEPPPDAALFRALPHRLAAALVRAVFDDARVSPLDLLAALDGADFTRFMIAPARAEDPKRPTADALAGASVWNFGGYLHEDYRRHDYQLGRVNARQALREHLTLPESHPLFAQWTDAQKKTHRIAGLDGPELPLIPLMPSLAEEAASPWPAGRDPLPALEPLLQRRLDGVVRGLLHAYVPRCWLARRLLFWLWRWRFAGRARRALAQAIRADLDARGL